MCVVLPFGTSWTSEKCTGLSKSWDGRSLASVKIPVSEGHAKVNDRTGPDPDQLYISCLSVRLCRPRLDEMQADGRRCDLQQPEKSRHTTSFLCESFGKSLLLTGVIQKNLIIGLQRFAWILMLPWILITSVQNCVFLISHTCADKSGTTIYSFETTFSFRIVKVNIKRKHVLLTHLMLC